MPEHDDGMLKRAGSETYPFFGTRLTYNSLSAHDLYYSEKLLIMEGSVEKLNELYGNSAKKEAGGLSNEKRSGNYYHPIVTEKTNLLREKKNKKYAFKVNIKPQIKTR